MTALKWEVAVPAGAELGERPFWDAAQDCLMWVDINTGRLHSYRPGAGDEVVLDLAGVAPGAAAPRRGGGYVLATAAGFRLTGNSGRRGTWSPSPLAARCPTASSWTANVRERVGTPFWRLAAK